MVSILSSCVTFCDSFWFVFLMILMIRRDSFITHRAFCDALAEESVRAISSNPLHNYPQVQSQFINNNTDDNTMIKKEQQNFTNPNPDNTNIPVWLYQDFQNPNSPSTVGPSPPHLSATALLQKASQMGHHVYADPCNQTAGFGLNFSSRDQGRAAAGFVHSPFGGGNNSNIAAVSSGVLSSIIRGQESPAMAGGGAGTGAPSSLNIQDMVDSVLSSGHGFEGMTKDFLGLRPLSHGEILNMGMAGFSSHIEHGLNENQNQTQKPWQGN